MYSFPVFLNEAVAHFKKIDQVWLVWPHKTDLHPPQVDLAEIVPRLEFYGYDADSDTLRNLRRQLPDGFVIRRIDQRMFERCKWRAEMEFYAGSMKHFLSHGIGICMLQGDGNEKAAQRRLYQTEVLFPIAFGACTRRSFARKCGFKPSPLASLGGR